MRVLLVDDELELLEQAKIFLERKNESFKVTTVRSPDKALAELKENNFDVIVSDYQMPEIDGLELLKIIREEMGMKIPFVMFTGKGREEVAMEALNLGADRYLQKGGSPRSQYGVLSEAIIQEVEHRRTRKSLEARKKQFERAIQNAPYPAMLQAEDGEVLLINNRWTEITGYEEDEIPYISDWTEKAYGREKDKVESEIESLFEEKNTVHEGIYTITTKSGEKRKWDFNTSPLGKLPDGRKLILSMANDITDRVEAQRKVKKSEEKYKTVFENTGTATCILEDDTTISLANREFEELSRYPREKIEGKMSWKDFVPDEDIERMEKYHEYRRQDEKDAPNRYEFDFIDRDGDVHHILLTIDVIPNTKKSVASLLDITDRKETEEALKESEKKYQAITEKSHDAIFVAEQDELLFVNESTCELTGYSKEEIYDMDWRELLHPEDREKIIDIDEKGRKGEEVPTKYEARILTKEGDVRYGDFRVEPIEYEDYMAVLGTIRDITEQKEKKEKLEKARKEWENIFQAIGHPTLILDKEQNILQANKAAVEVSGLTLEQLKGEKCYEIFHKSSKPPENCPVDKLIESGDVQIADMEMELVVGEYMVSVTPIFDDKGDIEKIIHIATDITERKDKERELQEERNFLEQIAEMSPVCITKLNADGEIIYANDRAEDVLGLSKSKIKGRTYNDIKWNITDFEGDPFPDEKLPFTQVKEKDDPVYGIKHAIEWSDGDCKFLSINATPIYDEKGKFDGMVSTIEDVTEEEKKERELKESRRRLKTLMDNMPGMAYRCKNNKNWTMKFLSDGCQDLTGYETEDILDDEVIPFREIIHPEDREYVRNRIQDAVGEGEPFKFEYRIKTKKGKIKWVWEKGRKVKIDGEEFLEGIITEVTERKEIEEKLRKSEEKYRNLFYETPLGTIYYDKNGVIRDCNQKFVEIIGSSKKELIGFDMLNRLEDDRLHDEVRSSLETGEGYYEGVYRSITSDKSTPVRIMLKGMKDDDGNIYAGIGLIEDITEKKEKEEQIEKEKNRYESLFEENPEALVEVDQDFNIVKVNSKFKELFKYKEEEILGEHLDDLVVPDDRMEEAETLNKKSKIKGYFDHDTVRVDKNGEEVHVSITGRPIKYGGKTRHLAVYRDINERKEAEKRENFLHSLLRHDVRNKAQLTKGYLELLGESCEEDIQEEYVEKASSSVREAEEIIDKVSKLRKIEKEEEISEIKLCKPIDKVLSELQTQLDDNEIEIDRERCSCEVKAGVLLEELFYNIIENSIKHSDCDKINIRIRSKKEECDVIIEDDGKGIPNRYKDEIFKKGFKRGKMAGSGLGMFMVKEIAENYGGEVDVQDSDLGGAKFDIKLERS